MWKNISYAKGRPLKSQNKTWKAVLSFILFWDFNLLLNKTLKKSSNPLVRVPVHLVALFQLVALYYKISVRVSAGAKNEYNFFFIESHKTQVCE